MSSDRAAEEIALLAAQWHEALDRITREDVGRADRLLSQQLRSADSVQEYADVRRAQQRVVRHAQVVAGRLGALVKCVDAAQAEWSARRRYTTAGLDELCQQLAAAFDLDPADASRRWLLEVLRALEMAEGHAATRIAGLDLPLEGPARAAASELAEAIRAWSNGDLAVGLAIARDIASGAMGNRLGVTDARVRVRAHRIAAWLSFEIYNDAAEARAALDEAIRLVPSSGRARAERAALFLRLEQVERAKSDAHRAVESRPDGATGHLVLGACAESADDLEAADSLYRAGLDRMAPHELATAHRRVSLLAPTGRMLWRMGERLVEIDWPDDALRLLDQALLHPIASSRPYGSVDVYRLRSIAYEQLGDTAEAAQSAFETGKRHYWNDEPADAVQQLSRAQELDQSLPDAGWYLAQSLMNFSFPDGMGQPDVDVAARARRVWDESQDRFGWPTGRTSWAYLTRATIIEALAYGPNAAAQDRVWEPLSYAERAIVHEIVDPTFADGDRWAIAAHYLNAARLDELALECADRADALGTVTYRALAERMTLLANAGRTDEVEQTAARIESLYGPSAWLTGVRGWVAYHDGRFSEALELLDRPISEEESYAAHWIYGLAALCSLAADDRERALRAYATMRQTPPDDGADHCDASIAAAALGDIEVARELLRHAETDQTTPGVELQTAAAFVGFASANDDEGVARLEMAIDQAVTTRQLDDALQDANLRLAALPRTEAQLQALRRKINETLAHRIATQRRALAADARTPAVQLEDALSSHADAPNGTPYCTLVAVKARRQLQTGSYDEAADTYESLVGTSFGPEAPLGLRSAMEAASAAHSSRGDVQAVRDIQARLSNNGWTGPAQAALATSAALVAAGNLPEAVAELEHALSVTKDAHLRRALHEEVATVAIARADADMADRHLAAALDLTTLDHEAAHAARLEVRRAVAAAMSRDPHAVAAHLHAALGAWGEARAFDPAASLRQELSLALEGTLAPAMAGTLRQLLMPLLKNFATQSDTPPAAIAAAPAESSTSAPAAP